MDGAGETGMQKRVLGKTSIEVTPIGLGGNKFSGGKGAMGMAMPDLSQEQVNGIVKAALDGGMNWIDTAELYGFGQSERAIARALKALGKEDGDVVVATKWSPFLRTAANIGRTISQRLAMLEGYAIDLYMVHNPFGFSSVEAEMEAMAELADAGKIRSIGVSNFSAEQMRRAHRTLQKRGLPLAVNQVQYSLLNRRIEGNGVLDTARELGVTIVAWAPLGSGALTSKYHDSERLQQAPFGRRMMLRRKLEKSRPLVAALKEIGEAHQATPAQIAVNWVVTAQGETVVASPGASKIAHAAECAAAMRLSLSGEEMARLDALSQPFV
jgi:aryl-alcohol dehydrogenase-like predicted oxidoreductase